MIEIYHGNWHAPRPSACRIRVRLSAVAMIGIEVSEEGGLEHKYLGVRPLVNTALDAVVTYSEVQ